jgi:integrase
VARAPLALGTHGKITVQQVGPKLYAARCRFRDMDGSTRKLEKRGPSKTAASTKLQDALKDRVETRSDELRPHSRMVDAGTLWLGRIERRNRPSTVRSYRWAWDSVAAPAIGQLRLREITVPLLEDFLLALERRGYAAEARRTIKAAVRGVLAEAVRRGALPANPARDLESIEGGSRAPARALQPGERDDFIAKLKADERAAAQDLPDMVQFALATGLRIGELLAVRWGDVDLVGVEARQGDEVIRVPVVHVRGNMVRVGGQGMVRFKGKTRTAVRSVPLPPFLVTMLALRKPDDAGEDEPLFAAAGRDGGITYRDPSNTGKALREARARITRGTDDDEQPDRPDYTWVVWHTFRKTAATDWARQGLSALMVANLLGHAKVSITQDVYFGRGELVLGAANAMQAAHHPPR